MLSTTQQLAPAAFSASGRPPLGVGGIVLGRARSSTHWPPRARPALGPSATQAGRPADGLPARTRTMGVGGGRAGGAAAQAAGELQGGVMTTDGSEFGVGYQEEELGRRTRDPRQAQASSTGKDDEKDSSHGSTAREQKEHIAELETEVGKLKQQLREARREARRGEEASGSAQGP